MTVKRIDLPSGGWVDVNPDHVVTERQRRPVKRKMAEVSPAAKNFMESTSQPDLTDPAVAAQYQRDLNKVFTPDDIVAMVELNDLIVCTIIVAASFLDAGEVCTTDTLLDMTGRDYDALQELAAPYAGSFMGVDFDKPSAVRDASNPT